MKVCIISGDAVGGVRKHVHDILLVSRNEFEFVYIHSSVSDKAARRDFVELDSNGVKRIQLGISKNPAFSDLRNIISIWLLSRRCAVDIFHGHGSKGGLYARVVGFLLRKPVIYTPHGGAVHPRFSMLKSLLFATVEFFLKFATTLFLFESQYTCTAYQKMAGYVPDSKRLISYNGIDLTKFSTQSALRFRENREVHLLTIGSLSTVKGQDIAIRAMAILVERGWKVWLDLCGDGEDRQAFESLAADCHVEGFVSFRGDIEDPSSYYASCDIVVIPSRFESFGYVAIEAALMERPIVASATGGLLETVINYETGLNFVNGNPEALADAIEQTLTDKDATQRRIYSARARAYALFDIEKMRDRLFHTYSQFK